MHAVDTIIFQGSQVTIGKFRCPVHNPRFTNTGPIQGYLIVFPRSSVTITHHGRDPVVADPNVVMFYNKHQEYRRGRLSACGDRCDWFAFDVRIVREVAERFDASVSAHPQQPFQYTHGFTRPPVYMWQHAIVRHTQTSRCDGLAVEENALAVLDRVIADAYRMRGNKPRGERPTTRRAHAALVAEARAWLATNYAQKITLEQIAQQLDVSSYHLCRVFRQQTGLSVHLYRTQLRLRMALDALAAGATDLTRLALDYGFSSHSHFTHVFQDTFGVSPSSLRGNLTRKQLRQMSKNLIAEAGQARRMT